MADVVVDASFIIALWDAADHWAPRARALMERLRGENVGAIFLDFLVSEVVTVFGRRASDQELDPAVFGSVVAFARTLHDTQQIQYLEDRQLLFSDVLGVMVETQGRLSFNDAQLVVLQRQGIIGDVASFDRGLDSARGFRRIES